MEEYVISVVNLFKLLPYGFESYQESGQEKVQCLIYASKSKGQIPPGNETFKATVDMATVLWKKKKENSKLNCPVGKGFGDWGPGAGLDSETEKREKRSIRF